VIAGVIYWLGKRKENSPDLFLFIEEFAGSCPL